MLSLAPFPGNLTTHVVAKRTSRALISTAFTLQTSNTLLQIQYDLLRDGISITNGPQILRNTSFGAPLAFPGIIPFALSVADLAVEPGAHTYTLVLVTFDFSPFIDPIVGRNFIQTVVLYDN